MKTKRTLLMVLALVLCIVLGVSSLGNGGNTGSGCNTDLYFTLKGAGLLDFSAFSHWGEDVAKELMHYGFYLGRGNVAAVTKALLGRAYQGESVGAIAKEIADAHPDMSPDIGSKTTQGDVIVKFETPLGAQCSQMMKGHGADFPLAQVAAAALLLVTVIALFVTSLSRPRLAS